MVRGLGAFSLVATVGLLAACNASNPGGELESSGDQLSRPPAAMTAKAKPMEGLEAAYCPTVTLREGTAILKKEVAGQINYVASLTEATRDCRVVDGKLRMEVGVVGRVTPGPVAQDGTVRLPIRIAILRDNKDVVYSELGYQSATINRALGAQSFVHVDRNVSIDQPSERNIIVYAGFDEGSGQ